MVKKKKIEALTSLRFLVAIHVILFHNISFFDGVPIPLWNFIQHGYIGVSFFFVLSGFILTYNYIDLFDSNQFNSLAFFRSRFLRIYPAYLTALIFSLPLFLYFLLKTLPIFLFFLKSIFVTVLSMALLQSWIPQALGSLNAPGWSVSTEAFLYFSFPFILPKLIEFTRSTLLLMLIGLICWILSLIPPFISSLEFDAITGDLLLPSMQSPYPVWRTFFSSFPVFHLPQFIIGILGAVFLKFRSKISLNITNNNININLLVLAILIILAIIYCTQIIPGRLLNNGLLSPFFALLLFLLSLEKSFLNRILSAKTLIVLGEASYFIYIFQEPIRSWIKLVLSKLNLTFTPSIFLFYLCILCIFSVFFVPFDNRLRSLLKLYFKENEK